MKTSTKLIIVLFITIILAVIQNVFSPITTTQFAVGQAEDSVQSFTNLQLYKGLMNYYVFLYFIAPLAFFFGDIKKMFKNNKSGDN